MKRRQCLDAWRQPPRQSEAGRFVIPRDAKTEDNSKCLELHREGPRRVQDLFVQSADSGVLLLNDVSRACAVCWLDNAIR